MDLRLPDGEFLPEVPIDYIRTRLTRRPPEHRSIRSLQVVSGSCVSLTVLFPGEARSRASDDGVTARSPVAGSTKISSFDPPLTAVRTAYPTPPFLPFLHPPVELAACRPGGRLHLDRRVNFAAMSIFD